MTARTRRGFSLVELVVALVLASLAMAAFNSLFAPILRSRIRQQRTMDSSGDAAAVLRAATRDLQEASYVDAPQLGASVDELSGCVNYDPRKGAGGAGLIDRSRPARWFRYCSQGGSLYYLSVPLTHDAGPTASCPQPRGLCADGALLARDVSPSSRASALFSRPESPANLVGVHLRTRAGDVANELDAVITLCAPGAVP